MNKFTSRLAVLSLSLAFVACGSDKDDDAAAPAPVVWNNTTVQNLVNTKCATAGCHNGSVAPNFKNVAEATFKANAAAETAIGNGSMPKTGTLSTSEKAAFTSFFN